MSCQCHLRGFAGFGALPSRTHVIVPAWQTHPRALRAALAQGSRAGGLAGFGASGAASGAAKGASAGGSIAGPYGAAIGAVLGAVAGMFHKNYFNVQQSNADCQQVLSAWNQYLQVQGHVAGRALGQSAMQVVFHGAVGAGLFPGNNTHLKFHNGTLQCAGHGDWVDEFLGATSCGAHNCMPDAVAAFNQQRTRKPPSEPDAVFLVDSILLPMNASAKIPWIANGAANPQVHQLLYDLADAYLANVSGTTPYVQFPESPPPAPTPAAPAAAAVVPTVNPSTPIASPIAASLLNPPAVGALVTQIPQPGTGTPLTLPSAGVQFTFAGLDTNGGWVIKDQAGQLWHLVGNNLQPMATAISSVATPTAAPTPTPTPTPASAPSSSSEITYTPADVGAPIPYTAPQSATPAGATAAISAQPASSSPLPMVIGLGLLAWLALKR